MSDKSNSLATAAVAWVFITFIILMALLYKDCQNTDEKKMECIEKTHDTKGCDCLFSSPRPDFCNH